MCGNKHEANPTSIAGTKENSPMRLTKRSLIKTAAIGSAFVGALALAAPASANSFGPTFDGTNGEAKVSYNDANDEFCVTGTIPSWKAVTNVRLYPATSGRGPSYNFDVIGTNTKCVSLERAYEDSSYYYQANSHSAVSFYS